MICATASPLWGQGRLWDSRSSGSYWAIRSRPQRSAMRILTLIRCGAPSKRSAQRSRQRWQANGNRGQLINCARDSDSVNLGSNPGPLAQFEINDLRKELASKEAFFMLQRVASYFNELHEFPRNSDGCTRHEPQHENRTRLGKCIRLRLQLRLGFRQRGLRLWLRPRLWQQLRCPKAPRRRRPAFGVGLLGHLRQKKGPMRLKRGVARPPLGLGASSPACEPHL